MRGPLARIVRCAVGTHRLSLRGGFQTCPYNAVTGMIGETTDGWPPDW